MPSFAHWVTGLLYKLWPPSCVVAVWRYFKGQLLRRPRVKHVRQGVKSLDREGDYGMSRWISSAPSSVKLHPVPDIYNCCSPTRVKLPAVDHDFIQCISLQSGCLMANRTFLLWPHKDQTVFHESGQEGKSSLPARHNSKVFKASLKSGHWVVKGRVRGESSVCWIIQRVV